MSSQPISFTGTEKVSLFWNNSFPTGPSRLLRYRTYGHLCHNTFPSNLRRGSLLKAHKSLIRALSLQAVTTDNGSEGSRSPGSSSSVEYAGIFQAEEGARRSLLYYVQVLYTNAKTQIIPSSAKDVESLDARQVIEHVKGSRLKTIAVQWWKQTQPWVKWPSAVFVVWFLIITTVYGPSVTRDLLPLWIFGPIAAGLIIKGSIQMYSWGVRWVEEKKVKARCLHVFEEVKTGQLPGYIVQSMSSKCKELIAIIQKKKSAAVHYVKSGQIFVTLKQYLKMKLVEFWEVIVDKYEDLRLYYLYLERKLKNII